jgi:hypothetical protein
LNTFNAGRAVLMKVVILPATKLIAEIGAFVLRSVAGCLR